VSTTRTGKQIRSPLNQGDEKKNLLGEVHHKRTGAKGPEKRTCASAERRRAAALGLEPVQGMSHFRKSKSVQSSCEEGLSSHSGAFGFNGRPRSGKKPHLKKPGKLPPKDNPYSLTFFNRVPWTDLEGREQTCFSHATMGKLNGSESRGTGSQRSKRQTSPQRGEKERDVKGKRRKQRDEIVNKGTGNIRRWQRRQACPRSLS